MIERRCPRCHSVLHAEDENTLIFCWNCGAAQVTLSEELQEKAAEQLRRAADGPSAGEPGSQLEAPVDPAAVIWKTIILIAAAVAAALSVISVLLPPLELLAWMAPSLVLAIYTARNKQTRLSAGLGARIGLLCGIFTTFGMAVVTAVQALVLRFGLHRMDGVQASMDSILLDAKTRAIQQSGPAAADLFNPFLTVPEFRVGFFLAGLASVTLMLIMLSTAGGAFSGFVRSRRPLR